MNAEDIREYCIKKKGVTESFPFDNSTLVFKVGNKIFALLLLEKIPLTLNLKCNPTFAIELREQFAFVTPGYHMNKVHWNTVELTQELNFLQLLDWIDHSYQLIINSLPKKEREQFG